MRERLRLSDLNVLYVCLDSGHGTTGHRVLADAVTFRNLGGSPLLVCREGSVLDREAEKQDIRRHHIDAHGAWNSFPVIWRLVRELVKGQQLDLVHCYSYEPLMVLGLALKRHIRIPLVYTCNEELAGKYYPFWHDYFIRRIDQVLCFSPALSDRVLEVLPLGQRKVGFMGAGLEAPPVSKGTLTDEHWKLIAFVKPDESQVERFFPLFMVLPLIESAGKKVILTLATKGSWYEHPHYELFKRTILERGLEHSIRFSPQEWGSVTLKAHHLFVGLGGDAPFEDHELEALFHQLPLLLPRTSARTQLLQDGAFGLTYLAGDVRELKVKALEMLAGQQGFRSRIYDALPELTEKHNFERYVGELFQLYERLCLQRLRFALKRRRIFASKA